VWLRHSDPAVVDSIHRSPSTPDHTSRADLRYGVCILWSWSLSELSPVAPRDREQFRAAMAAIIAQCPAQIRRKLAPVVSFAQLYRTRSR